MGRAEVHAAGFAVAVLLVCTGCLNDDFSLVIWNDDSVAHEGQYSLRFRGESERTVYEGGFTSRPGSELRRNDAGRLCDEDGILVVALTLANGTVVAHERDYASGGCGPQNVWIHLYPGSVSVQFVFTD